MKWTRLPVSGWLPIAMSLAALFLVLGQVLFLGAAREPDEGAAAHVFQLLIAAQVPLIAFFVLKRVPEAPAQARRVLALQFAAVLGALAPVYFLGL